MEATNQKEMVHFMLILEHTLREDTQKNKLLFYLGERNDQVNPPTTTP